MNIFQEIKLLLAIKSLKDKTLEAVEKNPQYITGEEMKSIFASKTFWFNLLTGVGTLIGTYGGMVPPSAAPYVAVGAAIINIGLRFVTTQPVVLGSVK